MKLHRVEGGVEITNALHKEFEAALAELSKAGNLAVTLLEQCLKRAGVRLSAAERKSLREQIPSMFESGDYSQLSQIVKRRRNIRLEIGAREVTALGRAHMKVIKEITTSTIHKLAKDLGKDTWSWAGENLEWSDANRGPFEARLARVWQRPFGAFGRYIQLAAYIGHLAAIHFTEGEARNKRLAHALLLLHSRAIAVAGEILCLMKSGYADGAAARWRTLHEIAVTAAFLIDRGERAAELYLSHWACEQHKGLLHFEEHCRALGYRRHGKRVVNASQCQVDELVKEHGEAFRHDYGWAAVALGIKRATFNDIEKLANAAFMRPHYRLASEQVHASSRGSFIRAGLIEQDPSAAVLLAGPSNYGFADPATNTARSLLLVTSSLGLVDPTIDTNVYGLILSRWMPRVAGEFARTQWQIERREERLNQGFKAIRKPGRRSDTSRRKRNATA